MKIRTNQQVTQIRLSAEYLKRAVEALRLAEEPVLAMAALSLIRRTEVAEAAAEYSLNVAKGQ